jgi:hypothetical protein
MESVWDYPRPPRVEPSAARVVVELATPVDGERVEAQPGGYYGGWITSAVTGPFKGDRGTRDW